MNLQTTFKTLFSHKMPISLNDKCRKVIAEPKEPINITNPTVAKIC